MSIELNSGELVGFLGPNGAGKSTLMKIITGYLAADEGKVEINGEEVSPDNHRIRQQVGYLPEHNPLYTRFVHQGIPATNGWHVPAGQQEKAG